MTAVGYDDFMLAFEFVSSADPWECNACLALDTGEIPLGLVGGASLIANGIESPSEF